MNPANPNVAASVRARLLNVAKAQGVDFNPACQRRSSLKMKPARARLVADLAWHVKGFEDEQTSEERALYAQLKQRDGFCQDPDPMQPDECREVRRSGGKNSCR